VVNASAARKRGLKSMPEALHEDWQLYKAQAAVQSVPSSGKGAAGVTGQNGKFILLD
jgi:hypothetical protein